MAINSKEYKNLTYHCHKILNGVSGLDYDFFTRLDDIRKIHKKYAKECEQYLYYPRHDMTMARMHGNDLKDFCNQIEIRVTFLTLNRNLIKENIYAKFYYKEIDITKIVVL